MAFSASQLNIAVNFDLTNSPKNFTLTDTTVYTGSTYSNVLGNVLVLKPGGTLLRNNTSYVTPDIDKNVSVTSASLGSLPLNTGLTTVVEGVYSFTYTVKIEDLLQSFTIVSNNSAAKTFTVNGDITALLSDSSSANYNCVDAVTTALTIVSATYSASTGLTTVTVGQTLGTLTNLAQFQFTVDQIFSKLFTQDYSYTSPAVCLNWVTDECCSSMTITDVTVYEAGSVITRLHTVKYPIGVVPAEADVLSQFQEVTISPIWTGTWTDVFTADITATNGIILITDSILGIKDNKVSADDGLCQVYACLSNMATTYTAYLTTAPQRALEMQKYISQASAAFMAYTVGKKCAEANYEQYLTLITDIADSCGCGCDCNDCADGVPTPVVGCCQGVVGSDYLILINSTTNSLTVSSVTVGATTTFDIGVDAAWLVSQIQNEIAVTDINDLADVNTTNITAATGQSLVWNSGLSRWERGTAQLNLVQLLDVDDTGLSNDMILYYDAGTSTFKFQANPAVVVSIATCTDVTLGTLADKDILSYDIGTSKWINISNTLDNLANVDTTGKAVGDSIKWDGTNWIEYTPIQNLDDLADVVITSVANNDRFGYVSGTGWQNRPLPTFTGGYNGVFGFSYSTAGYNAFSVSFDPITSKMEFKGVISSTGTFSANTSIGIVNAATLTADVVFPIAIIDSLGRYLHAVAEINASTGDILIMSYIDSTGATNAVTMPAGYYFFDGISLIAQ